ncbi:unnamed protein product [Allacma fusca]|uniref:Alpha-amylase n=1 Tax=Allacma fusca TaxID=39272 RepID=A0A8J2LP51_9HEXA|nr:unnamed protein product [Allacma fusca]
MAGRLTIILALAVVTATTVLGQHDPHFVGNRTVMVHLFEWRWNDIAEECERFLGPYGYGGVQTSPANENIVLFPNPQRPWYERYQPVSYKLETRSGTEQEFQSMVRRCNNVGVRIYVDAVINHMTSPAGRGVGTGGSSYDSEALDYPGVPFTSSDFNGPNECPTRSGGIEDFFDPVQCRNCKLLELKDLNQRLEHVRERIIEFFNRLIGYGVAGFRIDAAKHVWPEDLKVIFDRLNNLPTDHGFPSGARAFVVQEVIDNGGEPITGGDYAGTGRVTEFKASQHIGDVIRQNNGQLLQYVRNWGEGWDFLPDEHALVFVDNHDNQRGIGTGNGQILTFRVSSMYKMGTAFFLAWPYGLTRIMSSYYWDQDFQNGKDINDWIGPPHDSNFNTLPVTVNPDLTCGNGWVCEHRWRQIYNMARFRNVAKGTPVVGWWTNYSNQIAFSRGNRAFIAFNNDDFVLDRTFSTGLPGGIYCDVITGYLEGGTCTGKFITVGNDGNAQIYISEAEEDRIIAIHVEAKL